MNRQLFLLSPFVFLIFFCVCPQLPVNGFLTAGEVAKSYTDKEGISGKEHEGAVIGHLKTSDKMITIRSDKDGQRYTVKTKEGKLLAVDLSKEDLYAEFPDLVEVIERGLAGQDASLRLLDFPARKAIKLGVESD